MSWLLFDYGGVISLLPPPGELAQLTEQAGGDPAEFTTAYWSYRFGYDRGDLDASSFWQKVGAALGRAYPPAQVAELIRLDMRSWLHLDPGTLALIDDAAAAGHRLALLSNAPPELATEVTALPLAAHFDHLAFSCELRLAKPDPACFEAVLTRLGASPGDVFFLDDRPENIAAANALGMPGVQYSGAAAARKALAAHGINVP